MRKTKRLKLVTNTLRNLTMARGGDVICDTSEVTRCYGTCDSCTCACANTGAVASIDICLDHQH